MHPSRREILQASGLGLAALVLPTAPVAAAADTTPAATPLRFGINGHPYNTEAYNANSSTYPGISYATQVSMITAMGMTMYRTDIKTTSSGLAENHQKLLDLQGRLATAGITGLPVIYDNYSSSLTEDQNYQLGLDLGVGFANNYGHLFTHYSLGNEWELSRSLLLRDTEQNRYLGTVESHYDLLKVVRAAQWIKGANDGIKSVRPTAKTSVPIAGWFPSWWQQQLVGNVDLDFIDWHWYQEMQGLFPGLNLGTTNVLDYLWDRFGLPIWITESNYRSKDAPQSQQENELRQVNWYNEWYPLCVAHPHCEALVWHELLDQPRSNNPAYEERTFGVVKFPNLDLADPDYSDWTYKKLGRKLTGADQVIGDFESTAEGWALGLGPEFPGATGTYTRDSTASRSGSYAGLLTGNFGGGGNYVQISRGVSLDVTQLRLWARSTGVDGVGLRVVDSTGQTHQQRLPLDPSGEWQELLITDFAGGTNYVHFGGANDGTWHGPATRVTLMLNRTDLISGTSGSLRFDRIVATIPAP